MRNKPCLTLDDVFKMVAACRKAAAEVDEEPTIVPKLFIPVGPEAGGLSAARSGSTSGRP